MKIAKILVMSMLCAGSLYPAMAQTSGTLSFSVKTSAPSADYGTKHMAAIWIQNDANPSEFIKTVAKYGHEDDHLTVWGSISGSNLVDAVTSATLTSYGTLSVEWDGTDVSHNVVPDGDYTVHIEMGWGKDKTNDHAESAYSFTKGDQVWQDSPADNTHFSAISVDWQPVATNSISSPEGDNGISLFPNPSTDEVNVNLQDEMVNARIEVRDLLGKVLYAENYPYLAAGVTTIDISGIPTGLYQLTLTSGNNSYNFKLMVDK